MQRRARGARLAYVSDDEPGIGRRRRGKGFSYILPDGKTLTKPSERVRIESLAIPPAWTDVWISPDPEGHIQATGRDARGRKQYRYHPRWCEASDERKYDRLVEFGEDLPRIRDRVRRHLSGDELDRERVLAGIVRLIDRSGIRVGGGPPSLDESDEDEGGVGATGLLDDNIRIDGDRIRIRFIGKGGKEYEGEVHDPLLARYLLDARRARGEILFRFRNGDNLLVPVDPSDVNAYLRSIALAPVTSKDFRTWYGTLIVTDTLRAIGEPERPKKRHVDIAVREAAEVLNNTPTVCRNYYLHPAIPEAYLEGQFAALLEKNREGPKRGLREPERFLLHALYELG